MQELLKKSYSKICKKWNENTLVKNLIEDWLVKLLTTYQQDHNFLYRTPLSDYLNRYLNVMENLDKLNVYSIEDVIKNKNNYFYKWIEKIPTNYKEDIVFRLKKVRDEFVIDQKNGDFFLRVFGKNNKKGLNIEIMLNEGMVYTFHHELTHTILFDFKYAYPTYFPFFENVDKALYEGDAVYHENLLSSTTFIGHVDWNENTIENRSYELYYQLYCMLILSLPKEFVQNWEIGIFDVTIFSSEQKKIYAQLFAIMTILSAKTDFHNKLEDFVKAIDLYHSNYFQEREAINEYCTIEEQNLNINIAKYQKQIDELNAILNNPIILKQNYEENLQEIMKYSIEAQNISKEELEKQETLESYIEFLNDFVASILSDKKEEEIKKESIAYYKEMEFQKADFGLLLVCFLQQYIEQNLSIQNLYQMFVEIVATILEERKESYEFVDLIIEALSEENKQTR